MINICYSFCIKVCLSVSLKYIFFCLVGWFLFVFFFQCLGINKYFICVTQKKKKKLWKHRTLLQCYIRAWTMVKHVTNLFLSENHDCIFPIRYEMYAQCKFSLHLFYFFFFHNTFKLTEVK